MPRKMSRKADRYLQEEGEHLVRVLRIVDLGTQEGYQGSEELQLRITFECCEDIQTFKRKDGTEITGPSLLDASYTQKLSSSAKLFKLCKAVVGTKVVESEEFDPTDIVGKYLMLELEHKVSGQGNKYVKITDHFRATKDGIQEAIEGDYDPEQNEAFAWWLEEGTDWDKLDEFPEWLQDLIMASPEYEELEDDRNKPKSKKVKKTGLDLDEDEEEDKPKRTRKTRKKKEVVEEESDY